MTRKNIVFTLVALLLFVSMNLFGLTFDTNKSIGLQRDLLITTSGFTMTGAIDMAFSGLENIYWNTITVAKAGGDFAVIQNAIDSITDNDATHRYIIMLYPGVYIENVVMEEYVSIIGFDHKTTEIYSTSGTTVTAAPGGSATIQGVKIDSAPTADGAVCLEIAAGGLDVYSSFIRCTSATNGVEGKLVEQTGGTLKFRNGFFIYTMTGSSAGVATHNIVDVSGTSKFYKYNCDIDVDVSDVDDTIVGMLETSGAVTESISMGNTIHIDANSGSYTGDCVAFKLDGTSVYKIIQGNHVHVQSAGGGTGYIFMMDTSAGGGEVNASHNWGHVTGFTLNHSGDIAAGDTINGTFNVIDAVDGFTGAGTRNVVIGHEGDLTATGDATFGGNVGIGAAPTRVLDVTDGRVYVEFSSTTADEEAAMKIENDENSIFFGVNNEAGDFFGINCLPNAATIMSTASGENLQLGTENLAVITINNTQETIINGVDTGSEKLQVTGNASFSGTLAVTGDGHLLGDLRVDDIVASSSCTLASPTAAIPATVAGKIYYNGTDNHFYGYNGSSWVQLDN